MSDKNFLVGDTVWFYIRKHDFMSKGIIKEIFILDEIPFALIRNGHMETKMPISQIFHDDLSSISCSDCRTLQILWLDEEYEEPEVDWSNVPVDTLIRVKENKIDEWVLRYFAKYKD